MPAAILRPGPTQPVGTSTGTQCAPPAPESHLHARPGGAGQTGRDYVGRSKMRKSVSALTALLAGTGAVSVAGMPASAAAGPDLKVAASDDSYTSSGRKTATFGSEDKLAVGTLHK